MKSQSIETQEIIESSIDKGLIEANKITANNITYNCINELNPKFVGKLVFTSDMEALYLECNGFSNIKYLRGESLLPGDIRDFIELVRYEKPKMRKSRFLSKEAIIFGTLVLDKKSD